MVQATAGNASFGVAVDGGSGPGEGPAAVTPDPADATTISCWRCGTRFRYR